MNVLITGANGGLGTAVCQEFLASGAKVIGVAREWKAVRAVRDHFRRCIDGGAAANPW